MGGQFFAVYVAAGYVNGNHSANRTLQTALSTPNAVKGINSFGLGTE